MNLLKKPSEMTLDEFNALLNTEPDPTLIHTGDEGYQSLPIAFVEDNLRNFYEGYVQYEINSTRLLGTAIQKDIRIKVFHPIKKEWFNYDGSAAVCLENITQGKYADTVTVVKAKDESMADAICYSKAILKAAQRIGVVFGSNLNRDFERTPNGKNKSQYDTESEKFVFDKTKKYTKKDLLSMIAAGKITVEIMDTYLAERK
jgi:hypothetical protein